MHNKANIRIQTVPLYLCKWALMEHKTNQLRVYLAIKFDGSGYFLVNEANTQRITELLKISVVTFRKFIRALTKDRWIVACKRKNWYWVRGYKQLGIVLKNSTISSIRFENKDLLSFKAMCIGAVYSDRIKHLRRRAKNPVRYQSWRTSIRAFAPSTYFVANNYLAEYLKISKTTAIEYKALAEKAGYIKTKENLTYEDIPRKLFKYVKEANDLIGGKYVIRQGKVFMQEPDIIVSKIQIYYRGNLKRKKSDP